MTKDGMAIRWHGRGGQGAITAAKIVAKAAFASGFEGAVMVPSFGTERRGAPVFTSLKISRKRIYDLSPIEYPDAVVVLDHHLLEEVDVTHGLKEGGIIILNTPKPADDYHFNGWKVATADVTHLAHEAGLKWGIVNSGIIGAFAKATGLVDLELLTRAISEEFAGKRPAENARAAELTFANTTMGGH